jgi:hypothetical protein
LRGSLDSKPLDANSAQELAEIISKAQEAGITIEEKLIAALNKYKAAMSGDDEEAQEQALKELETQFRLTGISAEKATEAIVK